MQCVSFAKSNLQILVQTDENPAWEVTQSFVDKWWWLLGDEVVSQADFWRAERGEEPLKVPVVDIGSIVEEIP